MNNLDTIQSTGEFLFGYSAEYGIANLIAVLVVILVVVYFVIQMMNSRKQWMNDSDAIKKVNASLDTLLKEVSKSRLEHNTALVVLDQIQQRYSESHSIESCSRIAQEVLLGTKATIENKLIRTIAVNNIEKNWDRIEVKIREFVNTQWAEDMSILSEFQVLDGSQLGNYVDSKSCKPIIEFSLLAIRGKYSMEEVSDGLTNIYREIIATATMKLKREL